MKKVKYKLTIAEQYLCVPACLSMIVKAKCKEEYSQYEIADYFGVNIPNDEHIANVRNVFYTNDTNNIGVVIKDNEVNEFFNAFSIPLIETYRSASDSP